jgi:hypothetical protein
MATKEVAMFHTAVAVRWAMKAQEGQLSLAQVGEVLGVSACTIRRLR